MGVEVSWREIKHLCPGSCSLAQFLGALCHYIKTALGEEQTKRLQQASGNPNAFIREPIPTKAMWDAVQGMHSKTLSACFLIEYSNRPAHIPIIYRDMLEIIMESGTASTPLHLKIAAWHAEREREGTAMPLELDRLKTIIMPRQALLKELDPTGDLSVPQLRDLLEPLVQEYQDLIVRDRIQQSMDIKSAMKIYKRFYLLSRAATWGMVPVSCTCPACFENCVCCHTLLFAAVFKQEIRVPADWIAATVSQRKQCKSIKGTAGRKRMRILEERKCDEKRIDSKVTYLTGTSAPRDSTALILPEPAFPSSSSEDDFQVTVRSCWFRPAY